MPQQFTRVMPGDLITANLMNRIFDKIEMLETRIATLEAGGPQGPRLVITEVRPSSTRRVGETLTVVGRGFAVPSENNEVTVAGVRVPNNFFRFGGDDTRLVFEIPPVANLSSLSQPVAVRVGNRGESAEAPLTLLPAFIPPAGAVEVAYVEAPVIPIAQGGMLGVIQAGVSYVFRFTVRAVVNQQANYQMRLTLPGWDPQFLSDTGQPLGATRDVTLPAGSSTTAQPMSVRVRVTAPSSATDPNRSGTLRLDVQEVSGQGSVNPGGDTVSLAIGQAPELPEGRVRLSIRSVSPAPTQIVGSKVQFKRGALGSLQFEVSFKPVGTSTVNGRYNYSASIRDPSGWVASGAAVPVVPPDDTVSGATADSPVARTLTVLLTPGTGAVDTDLVINIRSRDDSIPAVTPPVNTTFVQPITVVN